MCRTLGVASPGRSTPICTERCNCRDRPPRPRGRHPHRAARSVAPRHRPGGPTRFRGPGPVPSECFRPTPWGPCRHAAGHAPRPSPRARASPASPASPSTPRARHRCSRRPVQTVAWTTRPTPARPKRRRAGTAIFRQKTGACAGLPMRWGAAHRSPSVGPPGQGHSSWGMS
jgi:hypothetical protein